MTPDSHGLPIALTAVALLLAALGALLLFRGVREDAQGPAFNLTDAGIRIDDGASVLRFGLEVQPTGRTAFRAETRPERVTASRIHHQRLPAPSGRHVHNFQQ